MQPDHYAFVSGDQFLTYEFFSEGPRGKIAKVIQFSLIDEDDIYNLAFGDLNEETGELDDRVVTDNGDSKKVLATVVAAIYLFCEQLPNAWIYATGSTASRTRLYRINLNKYIEAAENDFHIIGQIEDEWETYEKGNHYKAFLVQKKL